jgi:hypothetical protein
MELKDPRAIPPDNGAPQKKPRVDAYVNFDRGKKPWLLPIAH